MYRPAAIHSDKTLHARSLSLSSFYARGFFRLFGMKSARMLGAEHDQGRAWNRTEAQARKQKT